VANAVAVAALPLVLAALAGMSAETSARNPGAAAIPDVGPAKTVLALCVASVPVIVPEAVTGLPETVKMLGSARPTLVTVPDPAPPAGLQLAPELLTQLITCVAEFANQRSTPLPG